MPTDEGAQPRRAKKGASPPTPVTINPPSLVARLDAMSRERIDALEGDKQRLQAEVDRLHARLSQADPENARLKEALSNAESNSVLATILIGAGGFLVSYATFTGQAAKSWADAAAGCLLAGIVMLLWRSV